ncbi:MarR family winged helix-turn-helix transcriptional regulator [Nakamurella panacisegetis]|uniref:MarR family winged helix-turn-helix transcriptional regulator n=1 Tax=Nakamurella panacisegetis TaxID=1090615 RepID=UPI001E461068|nr:MarR family winged helix-turn-helix transcriptional regulator [Nakamurella panacisegetis]
MTETKWLNNEESRAWRALQHLNMPLSAALNRQLSRDSNLSNADYAVLVQLSEAPEQQLRARDLVQAIGWEKSRLSHHIRRMESRSLVSREECPTDGRGAFIKLTDTGRAAIVQAAPGHVNAVRSYFIDLLTPNQLVAFAEIAEAVGARLKADGCAEIEAAGATDDPCRSDRIRAASIPAGDFQTG